MARLRAHAGPLAVVWLIVATLVVVTASVATFTRHLDDGALRDAVRVAPYVDRDVIVTRSSRTTDTLLPSDERLRSQVLDLLPPALDDVVERSWGFRRTDISQLEGFGAVLTGDGVSREPAGFAPVVSLHTQTDIADDITVVEGRMPATDRSADQLEVVVGVEVAETLALRVGHDYVLHPGTVSLGPDRHESGRVTAIRVTGTFAPANPDDPVWEHAHQLLAPSLMAVIQERGGLQPRAMRAGLVTDRSGFDLLHRQELAPLLAPTTGVRIRLDTERLEFVRANEIEDAVAQLRTHRTLGGARIQTALPQIVDDVARRSIAVRGLIVLATAGIVGAGVMLLVATAGLIVRRRQRELHLLRARGGTLLRIAVRVGAETFPVVVTAAAVGWFAHRPLLSMALDHSPSLAIGTSGLPPSSPGAAEVALLVVGVLAVPIETVRTTRRSSAAQQPRTERIGPSSRRITVEAAVALLAVVGVLVARRRGLTSTDVDPFLAAVPLLVAVAAGLLILRIYPLVVRWLAASGRSERGPVNFLALAHAGRSGPGPIWTLLVIVVAAAVTGLSAGMGAALAVEATSEAGGLLHGSAFHEGLLLSFRASILVGVVFATLTVALLLVMPAADRARHLALLHLLGLRPEQARWLVVAELVPPTLVATAAGLLAGTITPVLLGSAIGLETLLGGQPPTLAIDTSTVTPLALVPVALAVAGALTTTTRLPRGARAGMDASM